MLNPISELIHKLTLSLSLHLTKACHHILYTENRVCGQNFIIGRCRVKLSRSCFNMEWVRCLSEPQYPHDAKLRKLLSDVSATSLTSQMFFYHAMSIVMNQNHLELTLARFLLGKYRIFTATKVLKKSW